MNILYLNYKGVFIDLDNNEYVNFSEIPEDYDLLIINIEYNPNYEKDKYTSFVDTSLEKFYQDFRVYSDNRFYELGIICHHLIYKNTKTNYNIAEFYEREVCYYDFRWILNYYDTTIKQNTDLIEIEFYNNDLNYIVDSDDKKKTKYFTSMLPCIVITEDCIGQNSLCNVIKLKEFSFLFRKYYCGKYYTGDNLMTIYLLNNFGVYTKRAIKK
ncbi:hypothetical protein Hokovirus_1_312 [Hokovirus HKV1]|uniref:Uncharacterized protein n=1 Tax=Hokovirus HKV1 TaxID=1977638 RepID=A0A1V0SFF1_9VIRU|nr:hypothetical protein Hokovirus_1_312 [Hokovirus HKV1]